MNKNFSRLFCLNDFPLHTLPGLVFAAEIRLASASSPNANTLKRMGFVNFIYIP
jgi:hypothetical protein